MLGFAACRAPRAAYRPTVDNVGAGPQGQAAAVYELTGGERDGQIRVWCDGPDPSGRIFRVGFQVRNDKEPDLVLVSSATALHFPDYEVDLQPREKEAEIVPPGHTRVLHLTYPLPGRYESQPPEELEVVWSVRRGDKAPPIHRTTFTRSAGGFVPEPLDTADPLDRPVMERSGEPPAIGLPFGADK